jgi:hypothetical protein
MALVIAAGRQPKLPTHHPITKSMYFLPRESVMMLPSVAATCSSAGSSLASGSRRRAGINDPYGPAAVRWPFPRRGLVAMNTAAAAPKPTAVRNDGFGSHFIAPTTMSGGSLACGAERETV